MLAINIFLTASQLLFPIPHPKHQYTDTLRQINQGHQKYQWKWKSNDRLAIYENRYMSLIFAVIF